MKEDNKYVFMSRNFFGQTLSFYVHFSEFCCSSQGKIVAEKHQDQMIKAFEHLIRKNRENNPLENCARVIGNAMNVLAELHVFKSKADKSFVDINKKYPTLMPGLIMEVTDPLAVK